jgi:hypothetical protein
VGVSQATLPAEERASCVLGKKAASDAALASGTGSIGTDLTGARVVSDGLWTGKMGPGENQFLIPPTPWPSFKQSLYNHHPASWRMPAGLFFLTHRVFHPKHQHMDHCRRPIRAELLSRKETQLRPKDGVHAPYQSILTAIGKLPITNYQLSIRTETACLKDPPIRAESLLQSEHISSSKATNQRILPAPLVESRRLTQPLQDLLGVGLFAERLECFRKRWGAALPGSPRLRKHGRKLPEAPNLGLREFLEVLKLLH